MHLYLRDREGWAIIEIEIYISDKTYVEIKPTFSIKHYSKFLISKPIMVEDIIRDFTELNDLRSWLWSRHFLGRNNNPSEYSDILNTVTDKMKILSEKYDLEFTSH